MPGFCVSCGAPLTGAFCNKCGARAVAPSASTGQPSAPASPAQAAVPPASQSTAQFGGTAAKGSGLGKVLGIIGGTLLLLFVIGVGAAVYGAYWVKHKVTAYSSALTGKSSEPIKVLEKGDSCR